MKGDKFTTETRRLGEIKNLKNIFCVLCVLCVSVVNSFSATFTLKKEAEVAGKEILLSDVSDSCEVIKIGVAPLPGRSRILKGQYIELVAKRVIPEIEITGNAVKVTRACQSLPKERIIKEIAKAIPEKVEVGKIPDLILPKGEISFEVEPIIKGEGAICKVAVLVDGVQYKRIRVDCQIQKFGDVRVAKRDIPVGSLIKADDVEVASRQIKKGAGLSEPVGKETRVLIKAGEVVTEDKVREPVLIRFGERVTIIKNGDGFSVTAEGKAASEGFLGKRIMVRNLSSNKLLEGVVVDRNSVEVK